MILYSIFFNQLERGEAELELTDDSSSGSMDMASRAYEKILCNADTDENSELVHLEFSKVVPQKPNVHKITFTYSYYYIPSPPVREGCMA